MKASQKKAKPQKKLPSLAAEWVDSLSEREGPGVRITEGPGGHHWVEDVHWYVIPSEQSIPHLHRFQCRRDVAGEHFGSLKCFKVQASP